ncbi:N-acetylmuramoyl-L-alanine amidase [Carboxylicivirga sp. N1Y90]|uniref:N-acetylmuramoyl-L-alanine amidase n=1 Tax=Carboxylicivirga fragile TaxID=3417571 RepID=UPI003D329EFC|nr:N-acetylmuramoyl-L-alanine amidase [Marinilabiliaceae bacterium N1Y90]
MSSKSNLSISDHLLKGDGIIPYLLEHTKGGEFQSSYPDSVIIHYTAGGSAESSARHLRNKDVKASAHLVIGRAGEIYQIVPFNYQAWHAGKSKYGSRVGYNKFSIGIELDNAGVLTKAGTEYVSWFGKKYQQNDVLQARHRNEQDLKYWHLYTPEQIAACERVVKLLIENYGIKEILGHEEIAPGRKQDPGPAFPLDRFRNRLLFEDRADDETPLKGKNYKVTASQLNIREGAGGQFKKVAQPLKKGSEVTILEEKDGWCKVKTTITGWVSKGHLDI